MFRVRSHHLHLPHFTFDNSKTLRLLYGIRIIRDLVNKMALFFMPIFLFEVGKTANFFSSFDINDFQRGMLTISIYYIIVCTTGFFSGVPAGRFLNVAGFQRSFVFAFLIRALFFVVLYYSKANPSYLLFAALLDGFNSQFFWGGYYSLLSGNALKKNMGKDMGILHFLLQVVAVISPAISGVIAFTLGIEYLFLIGLVLTLATGVFAINMDTPHIKNTVSFSEFFEWLREPRFQRLGFSFMGKYMNDATIYIWPLYVFLLLGSIDKVGYIYTMSLFLAMIFTFFAGSYIDHHKSKKPFFLSGSVISMLWLVRTQVFSIWSIALVDMFDKLASNVYTIFFDTMIIKRGKGHSSDSFFIYREMIMNFAGVIFWTAFGAFFLIFSGWTALFIFAGLGVMLSMLVRENKITS